MFKKGAIEVIDEVILSHAEKLLIYYAKEYQERPKNLINCFLKFNSIRMASTLIIFWARKNGVLEELKKEKTVHQRIRAINEIKKLKKQKL